MRKQIPANCDIPLLAGFIASSQHDDNDIAPENKIESVARPFVDAHFVQARTEAFMVADIAASNAQKSFHNRGAGLQIAQILKPVQKTRGIFNLVHDIFVA